MNSYSLVLLIAIIRENLFSTYSYREHASQEFLEDELE